MDIKIKGLNETAKSLNNYKLTFTSRLRDDIKAVKGSFSITKRKIDTLKTNDDFDRVNRFLITKLESKEIELNKILELLPDKIECDKLKFQDIYSYHCLLMESYKLNMVLRELCFQIQDEINRIK